MVKMSKILFRLMFVVIILSVLLSVLITMPISTNITHASSGVTLSIDELCEQC